MKTSLCILGVMALATSNVLAAPINMTTDDFQGYQVGDLPTAAGGTHGAYSYAANTAASYTKVAADGANQYLDLGLTNSGATYTGRYTYASPIAGTPKTFDTLAADNEKIVFQFDVYVPAGNTGATLVALDGGGVNYATRIDFVTPANGQSQINFNGTSDSGKSINTDTWYSADMEIYQKQSDWVYKAKLTNLSDNTSFVAFSDQSTLAGVDLNTGSYTRIRLYQYAARNGGSSTVYFDNLSLQIVSVPEPASVALYLLASGGLLLLRPRRRKSVA